MALQSTSYEGKGTVAAAGTANPVGNKGQRFGSVEFTASKGKGVANTGNVYIGFSNLPQKLLAPGDVWSISVDPANNMTLADVWIDAATTGDQVCYEVTEK